MRLEANVTHESGAARVASIRELDDGKLVIAAVEQDEAAWRELMRRHASALREAARDVSDRLTEADLDDCVSDLWLSLVEENMRRLRAFNPARGASLLSWLTIRLAQIVYDHDRRALDAPVMVPLAHAEQVADPRPTHGAVNPTLMRVEEVAKRWGLDRKTVYAMIDRGEISARRCGRLVRIPRKVVESFESQASVAPERLIKCR